ncbi:extensin [Aplysia californica]|uniref:Extensin n=1 Tax=Aplysia californica TaxID=6500 RepID=A0ABM0JPT1_APLCA|nr:extensin [Aplysia californica]XP_005098685.1 extensin [Aplysia californica]
MQSRRSMMNDLDLPDDFDYGLYKFFTSTSTTTVRPRRGRGHNNNVDIDLDDTAPLPLLIGIGLALFIGFVILILICCLCRRKRPAPSSSAAERPANAAYQRAPVTDGGMAYPMTVVPPVSYANTGMTYQHPHPAVMAQGQQHNYGVIGPGVNHNSGPHSQFQPPPPHFGGVPTFPPNQYLASVPIPPAPSHTPVPGGQAPSLSHSSQASTVSGTTADPLVPSASPSIMVQQQQQQQHPYLYHHQQQQQTQMSMAQPLPQVGAPLMAAGINHHPHLLQQQQQPPPPPVSGGDNPGLHYPPPPLNYSSVLASEHTSQIPSAPPNTTVTMGTVTPVHSIPFGRPAQHPLSSSNEEEEEEEEEE